MIIFLLSLTWYFHPVVDGTFIDRFTVSIIAFGIEMAIERLSFVMALKGDVRPRPDKGPAHGTHKPSVFLGGTPCCGVSRNIGRGVPIMMRVGGILVRIAPTLDLDLWASGGKTTSLVPIRCTEGGISDRSVVIGVREIKRGVMSSRGTRVHPSPPHGGGTRRHGGVSGSRLTVSAGNARRGIEATRKPRFTRLIFGE